MIHYLSTFIANGWSANSLNCLSDVTKKKKKLISYVTEVGKCFNY